MDDGWEEVRDMTDVASDVGTTQARVRPFVIPTDPVSVEKCLEATVSHLLPLPREKGLRGSSQSCGDGFDSVLSIRSMTSWSFSCPTMPVDFGDSLLPAVRLQPRQNAVSSHTRDHVRSFRTVESDCHAFCSEITAADGAASSAAGFNARGTAVCRELCGDPVLDHDHAGCRLVPTAAD